MDNSTRTPASLDVDEKKYIDDNANSLDIANGTSIAPLSAEEDRKLTNRVDLKLVPVLGFLYMICFLDRTNIGKSQTLLSGFLYDFKDIAG